MTRGRERLVVDGPKIIREAILDLSIDRNLQNPIGSDLISPWSLATELRYILLIFYLYSSKTKMANPQPKFDLKMLVLPAMMFLNGKIDFKDPQVLNYTQIAFVSGKWIFWQKY